MFNSPEVAIGEGVAGSVLEIEFEGFGFKLVGEIDGDNEIPRGILGGMFRGARIVLAQAFGQIGSQANVSPVRMGLGAEEVDVHYAVTLRG